MLNDALLLCSDDLIRRDRLVRVAALGIPGVAVRTCSTSQVPTAMSRGAALVVLDLDRVTAHRDGGAALVRVIARLHPGLPIALVAPAGDAVSCAGGLAAGAAAVLAHDCGPIEFALAVGVLAGVPNPTSSAAGAAHAQVPGQGAARPRATSPQPAHAMAAGARPVSAVSRAATPGRTAPNGHAVAAPGSNGPGSNGAVAIAPAGATARTRAAGPAETLAPARAHVEAGAAAGLTVREVEVLHGMAEGMSNAEIGHRLYLSEDTVKTHARRLFRKLEATDRAHAVAIGFRRGLVG